MPDSGLTLQSKAGITPDVVEAMTALSATLSKSRKKRAISPSLVSVEGIQSFSHLSSHPLHKTTQVCLTSCVRCSTHKLWARLPGLTIDSALPPV